MVMFLQKICSLIKALVKKTMDFLIETERALGNRDPIMDIVIQNPIYAIWFIKVVMLFGVSVGLLISLPCVVYLLLRWEESGLCDKDLRWWLAGNCFMQMAQAPLRYFFFVRLHTTRNNRQDIIQSITRLTNSRGWNLSKLVSIFNYCWFILGVIRVFKSSNCEGTSKLWLLCVIVIIVSILRLFVTLFCFYYSFPQNMPDISRPPNNGLPRSKIELIPKLNYEDNISLQKGLKENCSICLCEFEKGEEMRLLLCNHNYHVNCIDEWLLRNNACPLCQRTAHISGAEQEKGSKS